MSVCGAEPRGSPRWWCGVSLTAERRRGKERKADLSAVSRDLYVLALAELQAVDESDELSYFQIMGAESLPIHSHGFHCSYCY